MPMIGILAIAALIVATYPAVAEVCCCKTYSGGECRTETAKCGDKLPGCFCAFTSVPAPRR